MTGFTNEFVERLFLLKSPSQNISVPCRDLEQHQLDGIRFLFRQFRKVKPGVILNFPPGCGTAVQVAIFLSAILPELEKPVLILYDKESEKDDWVERFDKWTTIDKDLIAIDPQKKFVKKSIQIINTADIAMLPGRQWSVVIIKSNHINLSIKCGLKVDFKIWITSVDMKKDYLMLRTIYTWMYPKSAKLLNELISSSDEKETLKSSLLLDSLLEDVLLSRGDLKSFSPHKRHLDQELPTPTKISKKNKDATGTKIKRSKKSKQTSPPVAAANTDDEIAYIPENTLEISLTIPSDTENINDAGKVKNINNSNAFVKVEVDEPKPKLDVETFIRDNAPLEPDSRLCEAAKKLDDMTDRMKEKEEESKPIFVDVLDESVEGSRKSRSFSIDSNEDSIQESLRLRYDDTEAERDTTIADNLTFQPVIENVFSMSSEENSNTKVKLDSEPEGIKVKTEIESSDGGTKVVVDQESKIGLTTNVIKQTDCSFDCKIKDMEERAVKKFKGSILDNIF